MPICISEVGIVSIFDKILYDLVKWKLYEVDSLVYWITLKFDWCLRIRTAEIDVEMPAKIQSNWKILNINLTSFGLMIKHFLWYWNEPLVSNGHRSDTPHYDLDCHGEQWSQLRGNDFRYCHEDFITWKHFLHYWSSLMGTTGDWWIPPHIVGNMWHFLYCQTEQTVEPTVELLIWVWTIHGAAWRNEVWDKDISSDLIIFCGIWLVIHSQNTSMLNTIPHIIAVMFHKQVLWLTLIKSGTHSTKESCPGQLNYGWNNSLL